MSMRNGKVPRSAMAMMITFFEVGLNIELALTCIVESGQVNFYFNSHKVLLKLKLRKLQDLKTTKSHKTKIQQLYESLGHLNSSITYD